MSKVNVAVVILNYNGEKLLKEFLPIVLKNSTEAEIYVADNGSSDQSLSVLESFPSVKVIRLENNFGFCGGYNKALQQIDANYYALVNSDIEVTPGWLTPLINLLESNRQVGAVQPKILSFHEKDKFARHHLDQIVRYAEHKEPNQRILLNFLEEDVATK